MKRRESKVCIYCGRTIRNRRAWRKVEDPNHDWYACVACVKVLELCRAKTVEGKRRYIKDFFPNFEILPPGYVLVVKPDGLYTLEEKS